MHMKIKHLISGLLAAIFLAMPLSASAFDAFSQSCTGAAKQGPVCQQEIKQTSDGTDPALQKIHVASNVIALVTATAAIIIIVYAGITYATASGNAERAKSAQSMLSGAIIGLVLVALAWTIVTFVSDRVIKT
jgi:membrane associated rhomboid family serine protease